MAAVRVVLFDQRWKATISNAQEAVLLDSLGKRFNYQANVPNPSFNPSLPVSPENSPIMANPDSKEDYICKAILADILQAAKVSKMAEQQQVASQQASQAVEAEFANIAVSEDVV
jgi:hypothetical protein